MNTAQRLEEYYPFDSTVIDAVSDAMISQERFPSYSTFINAVGANNPLPYKLEGYFQRQILDIRRIYEDDSKTIVVHLPMGNPLDIN